MSESGGPMTGPDTRRKDEQLPRVEHISDGIAKSQDRIMQLATANGLALAAFTVHLPPGEEFIMPLEDKGDVEIDSYTFEKSGLTSVSYRKRGDIIARFAGVTPDGKLTTKTQEKTE